MNSVRFTVNGKSYIQKAEGFFDKIDFDNPSKLKCILPAIKECSEKGTDCVIDVSFNNIDYSASPAEAYTVHVYLTPILNSIIPDYALSSGGDKIELIFDGLDKYLEEYSNYSKKNTKKAFKLIRVKWSWQSPRYRDLYSVDNVIIENGKVYCYVPQCIADNPLVRVDVALDNAEFAPSNVMLHYFDYPIISSVSPESGPVGGGTTLSIKGKGFIDTKYIVVRFFTPQCTYNVKGTFVNENEIICVSIFIYLLAPLVQIEGFCTIEVSLNGQQYNIQKPLLYLFVVYYYYYI